MNKSKLTIDNFIQKHIHSKQKQHIALLRFKLRNYRILCVVLLVLHFIFYMSK